MYFFPSLMPIPKFKVRIPPIFRYTLPFILSPPLLVFFLGKSSFPLFFLPHIFFLTERVEEDSDCITIS